MYSCAAQQDFNPADLHAFLLAVMQAWRTSANVGWWLGRNPQTRSRRGRVSVLCNSRRCFCVWRTMSAMLAHLCPRSHPAVVKCRVLSADPTAKKGLKLSFVSKKKAAPAAAAGAYAEAAADGTPAAAAAPTAGARDEGVAPPATSAKQPEADQAAEGKLLPACFQAGDVVHGIVTAIHSGGKGEGAGGDESVPTYLELEVAVPAGNDASAPASAAVVRGRLDVAHLADHPVAVAALLAAVKVGSSLGPLLVLQRLEVSSLFLVEAWVCM